MIYLNQHINCKGNLKNNHGSKIISELQYKAVRNSGAGGQNVIGFIKSSLSFDLKKIARSL
jgi:hypothetical protein